MYYVIKRQHETPLHHFIGFIVDKYITSKTNENIIFEFKKKDKVERKWVKKEDIILLSKDKALFLEIFNQLKMTEAAQQELIDQAKEQLEQSIDNFATTMNDEIEKISEIKNSGDVPCLLNNI